MRRLLFIVAALTAAALAGTTAGSAQSGKLGLVLKRQVSADFRAVTYIVKNVSSRPMGAGFDLVATAGTHTHEPLPPVRAKLGGLTADWDPRYKQYRIHLKNIPPGKTRLVTLYYEFRSSLTVCYVGSIHRGNRIYVETLTRPVKCKG